MGAFVAPIIAGLGALTGLFGGPQAFSNTTNSTTTPNLTGPQSDLINSLFSNYQGQINNVPAWNQAYVNNGTNNILKNALASAQNANDITSQRGIARTTAGAQALNDQSQQQGSQLSTFLNQAPIAEQSNLTSLLNNAGSFAATVPTGSSTSSTSSGYGNAPANPIGGAVTGGATALAGILGQQSAQSSLNSILKGLNLGSGSSQLDPSTYPLPSGGSSNPDNSSYDPNYTF